MEPRTKAPPQRFTPLAPSVCLKRHVTARRPTEKKKTRPGHCQQIILLFFALFGFLTMMA